MSTDTKVTKYNVCIVDTLPKPSELPDGTVYGTHSVTLPNKTKLTPYHHARWWDGEVDTETGFTRRYLRTLPKRRCRRDEYLGYLGARPPLYVSPSILKNACYVDIVSAYPSIYRVLGWKIDYLRGQYMGVNDVLDYPYPASWKAGRSYVVSGARALQTGRYVSNGKIITKPYASPYSNPQLVAAVYDVLTAFAWLAVRLRAIYWNVDGGIMHSEAAKIFMQALQSVGLQGRIKYEGDAVVLASGYWSIGRKQTLNWIKNQSSGLHPHYHIGMSANEADWIYKAFRRASECRR